MSKNVMRAFNTPKKDDGVRNVFDLSQRHIFSAKAGQIIPVACVDTVPGDKFELDLVNIARTMPLNTAAFTRMKQSFDWVFVPYRSLWSRFNEFIAQRNDPRSALYGNASMDNPNMTPMYVPNISVSELYTALYTMHERYDMCGFDKMEGALRLCDMLGYGDYVHSDVSEYSQGIRLNLWHALAYQKACSQFYRDSVHDPLSDAYAFNVDDVQGTSVANSKIESVRGATNISKIFELRYKPWKKDIVTGTMPTMQYGAVSAIPLSADLVGTSTTPVNTASNYNMEFSTVQELRRHSDNDPWYVNSYGALFNSSDGDTETGHISSLGTLVASGTMGDNTSSRLVNLHSHPIGVATIPANITLFDIIQLRKAEAVQKWKERTLRAGFHTDKQFMAHYGVSPDEDGRWCADFIGSYDSYINIDEVITTANNNYTSGGSDVNNNVGDIAGKGIGVTQGNKLHFETNQFGVLMCLYSCIPEADYASYGVDPNNTLIERFDYFTSEYENLGLQAVPQSIYNLFEDAFTQVIGYGPRYWNYKTALDKVHGEFNYRRDGTANSGTLYDWATPRRDLTQSDDLPTLGAYYVNPSVLDSIFAVAADSTQKTDQFLINAALEIKAIRGMSVIGLPY